MTEAWTTSRDPRPEPDFHGAAVIDERGREIPITEAMVRRACQALEQQWHYPLSGQRRAG